MRLITPALPVVLLVLVSLVLGRALPVKHLHLDIASAQAAFLVPCSGCGIASDGLPTNESFLFNLQAYPSETSCGPTNLSLNGIPLNGFWESAGVHSQGRAFVPASGRELSLRWYLDCLLDSALNSSASSDDAQLLTLTIDQVDSRDISSQLAGFTVSFKQLSNPPELLRLSTRPELTAKEPQYSSAWRDPPDSLRLKPTAQGNPRPSGQANSFKNQIDEIRRLEAEVELLLNVIEEKKKNLKSDVKSEFQSLKTEIYRCESFSCVLKAVLDKAHGAAKLLYWAFRPNAYREQVLQGQSNYWSPTTDGQYPTKMDNSDVSQTASTKPLPTRDLHVPEQAHCSDGSPGYEPPSWNEKADGTAPNTPGSTFRKISVISFVTAFFQAFFVLTGLSALFACIRRHCCSLRSQVDRAARREQRRTERAYQRSARRQAIRDWWHGRGRIGRRGRTQADMDEKRNLVQQQEGILEENMQDEIRQLQITEEIQRLRRTHNTIDELVRAEEGRSRRYQYAAPYRQAQDAGPAFVPGPISITIPPPSATFYSPSDTPPTPLSHTSSLPDYQTEDEMSNPPSYHSEDDSSDYTPSSSSADARAPGTWTPASSIPNLSPRISIETVRTFL